jgi:NAD(P)-dependent dehydrogenase (short-subunit alcohol dehydrogenase family)
MIEYTDQAVIVTGAGRGLGRQYAMELARRGASVLVNDLGGSVTGDGEDPSVADAVVAEIEAAGGIAVASHDSVATPEGGAAIVSAAVDAFGRVDAVVSNAGIIEFTAFDEINPEAWRRTLAVHVDGGFHVSQPAFRWMKEHDGGRFVFISSSGGAFGIDYASHYATAKAAIIGLTNNVAIEGAGHGIRANAVMPYANTRMGADLSQFHENSIMQKLDLELVVPLVAFLASRDCELTHQCISACAGRYARVFVGVSDGWLADEGTTPSAEDILDHLDLVTATDPYIVPGSLVDEMIDVAHKRHTTL